MKMNPLFNRKKVLGRLASLFLIGAMAVAFQGVAYAHFPIVFSATPSCNNGTIVITFTINSWDIGSALGVGPTSPALGAHDGENSNVLVLFNGVQVASGAFVDPVDSFSGMANAPLGTNTVLVSATAVATWGDTYPGGETSTQFNDSITVDLSTITCAPPPGNGRFTGGGKVVVSNAIVPASGSVTVTKGFEVDCDMMPAHENLELNWGGNHFHMDLITSASCTLSGIAPNPPTAPVNRIDATGTGSYNGTEGYTVVFTLWDHGEPGVNDEAGFVVCQTADPTSCTGSTNIVLSVPLQAVTTGNIQAHVDQK